LGAMAMLFFRRNVSADILVSLATALFAFATFAAGRWQNFAVLSAIMLIGGVAWIQILASLNVSAQTMSPGHMRARAISMYLLVLQGGLAGGAALWGEIAERVGISRSLSWAAIGLGVGMLATCWFRLRSVEVHPNALAMD
jgi:predicted MFS family arabinose efflux permease